MHRELHLDSKTEVSSLVMLPYLASSPKNVDLNFPKRRLLPSTSLHRSSSTSDAHLIVLSSAGMPHPLSNVCADFLSSMHRSAPLCESLLSACIRLLIPKMISQQGDCQEVEALRTLLLQAERSLLYLLRGYMELCIYPPRPQPKPDVHSAFKADLFSPWTPDLHKDVSDNDSYVRGATSSLDIMGGPEESLSGIPVTLLDHFDGRDQLPLAWSCSEEFLLQMLQARDPAGEGLQNRLALRLLLYLLHWSPHSRPTPAQVLRHAYFVQDEHQSEDCHGDSNIAGWC